MNKYLKIGLFLTTASIFIACGGEDESFESEVKAEVKKVEVNKKAITFPELPTGNDPTSTINIETH